MAALSHDPCQPFGFIGPNKLLLLNNAARIPELFKIGDAFMFEHYDPKLLTKEAIVQDCPDPNGWTFRRDFSHAAVSVDLETRTAKIDWK